jgi:transcriptional regulator with XRE-family HTH domain
MFIQRLEQMREQLKEDQKVIAEDLQIGDSNYTSLKSAKKTPPWIEHIKNFVKKRNITPEKLYWLITGEWYNRSQIAEVPDNYITQTKLYIKSLENQIEELKHQREFLEGIVKDALVLKSTIEGHTQQELTSQETTRQNAGTEIVGKKLKRPQTADP